MVPHITDAIQEWIERVAAIPVDGEEGPADICVIELGGTIGYTIKYIITLGFCFFFCVNRDSFLFAGDIESAPFIEALGQFSYRVGKYPSESVKAKENMFWILMKLTKRIFWLVVESRHREFLSGPRQPRACA